MPSQKERLTVSLSSDLLKLLDSKIDGIYLRNRSHAIESLLTQVLGLNTISQAVFLAGGEAAEQMKPVLLEALTAARQVAIDRFTVITGHWGKKMIDSLTSEETAGFDMAFAHAESGDAGALRDAEEKLAPGGLVAVNTSAWPDNFDLADMMKFHERIGRVATVYYTDPDNSSGIYIFAPDIFRYIPDRGFRMFAKDVFPSLKQYQLLIEYQPQPSVG